MGGWRLLLATVALTAAAVSSAQANEEHSVRILFLAKYESIEKDMEDFNKQFNVMLLRTGAVDSGDLLSAVVGKSEHSSILVTVSLATADAAVRLTDAVLGRHLSVYIDGVGYIGVIPGDSPKPAPATTPKPETRPPPTTTERPSPRVTTVPRATTKPTEHPAKDRYVWLNEYTSDNENINDCSLGHVWSGMVLSRMPVGCHRFQHALTHQDEYNYVSVDGNGAPARFGMICDPQCSSCITQQNITYNACIETWGGSVAVYAEGQYCIGASYIELDEGALSIFRYSQPGCDLEKNPGNALYTRNYPAPDTEPNATCHRDGTRGKFYQLSRLSDENGDIFYNGKLDCADEKCSQGCTEVNLWQQGECHRDERTGNGVIIDTAADVLNICTSGEGGTQQDPLINAAAGAPVSEANAIAISAAAMDNASEPNAAPAAESTEPAPADTDTAMGANIAAAAKPSYHGAPPAANSGSTDAAANLDVESTFPTENKKITTVMIAAGCVMAVAFITIGVLHRRKSSSDYHRVDAEDEDIYNEYDYDTYDQYDHFDYEDERLITDI